MPKASVNDGIELDYEVRGADDGRPLVLIRGLGTQRILWPEELLEALCERGFRVIAFDNRDVGLSTKLAAAGPADVPGAMARAAGGEPIDSAYTVDDMADDVAGLLDALGLETAHVAGISMGGMIVQVLALRHVVGSARSAAGDTRGDAGPALAARRPQRSRVRDPARHPGAARDREPRLPGER
jgi:pimeloyl-ACP methyl ester carboxylesterase